MNLLEKAKAYANGGRILIDWIGHGGEPVSTEKAQGRANTCILCVNNSEGLQAAYDVAMAIKSQLELKNNLKLNVENEKELKTCHLCLCPLKLKVWTPIEYATKYMTTEELKSYPGFCWLRNEQ